MGFTCQDAYTSGMVKPLEPKLMDALAMASARATDGSAAAALTRWFGDASPAFGKEVGRTLRQIRSNINVKPVSVAFMPMVVAWEEDPDDPTLLNWTVKGRNVGENAAAFPGQRLAIGSALSIPMHLGVSAAVYINEAFRSLPVYLPRTGGRIDSSGWNQSRFETIVHELSHFYLQTVDVVAWGNPNVKEKAYGAQRAEILAANSPASAKTNAENWAIFVEAAGVWNCS